MTKTEAIKQIAAEKEMTFIDVTSASLRTVEEAEDVVGDLMTDELLSIVNLYEEGDGDDFDAYVSALIILNDRGVDFESF
jgi:predicted neutral ceramidase superfamily lipid hydrolase